MELQLCKMHKHTLGRPLLFEPEGLLGVARPEWPSHDGKDGKEEDDD